jgi:hypothetical protein
VDDQGRQDDTGRDYGDRWKHPLWELHVVLAAIPLDRVGEHAGWPLSIGQRLVVICFDRLPRLNLRQPFPPFPDLPVQPLAASLEFRRRRGPGQLQL